MGRNVLLIMWRFAAADKMLWTRGHGGIAKQHEERDEDQRRDEQQLDEPPHRGVYRSTTTRPFTSPLRIALPSLGRSSSFAGAIIARSLSSGRSRAMRLQASMRSA